MAVAESGGKRRGVIKKKTEAGRANVQAPVMAVTIRNAVHWFDPRARRFSTVTCSRIPLDRNRNRRITRKRKKMTDRMRPACEWDTFML